MKIKWQWFVGGQIMFWVTIIMFVLVAIGFTFVYIVDPTTCFNMEVQDKNPAVIKGISEEYVSNLGIKINKPIVYRFAKYKRNKHLRGDPTENVLMGTFHEWNGIYYIDISSELDNIILVKSTVVHETRHMIIEYMKDQNVIDLTKYTEEIAEGENTYYNNLFINAIYLLKNKK